ncbi:MAG TPA: phosphoribosyltransferase family protein [Mycobacteriales bacterium]|nr:phosphoribosyltransferase family protein [Mycobacteriales bacterium]
MLITLLDLICPRRCVGCGALGDALCEPCARPLQAPARLRRPTPCPPGLPVVFGVAEHHGAVRAALVAHKDRGRTDLTPMLAQALARAVAALRSGPVTLVPVPSSRHASRARGYDHALRLARGAAAALPHGEVAPVLVRVRRTTDQVGLGAAARAANTAGAFAVLGDGRRWCHPVILVDDLMTTGSTLAEAARALTEAGVRPHGAAVVASRRKLSRR